MPHVERPIFAALDMGTGVSVDSAHSAERLNLAISGAVAANGRGLRRICVTGLGKVFANMSIVTDLRVQ